MLTDDLIKFLKIIQFENHRKRIDLIFFNVKFK